jgi:FdhD protein
MNTEYAAAGTDTRPVLRIHHGTRRTGRDTLAQEVPLALAYNGISHATLLVSPNHLDDLVLGFSLTEGILNTAGELYDQEIERTENGLIAHIRIASERLHRLKLRRRQLAGRTGCGLCGLENLSEVRRQLPAVKPPQSRHTSSAIVRAANAMLGQQTLRELTGATHAAAWANPSGDIVAIREDIGRHNALDKLLGALCATHKELPNGFCVISSRASFEMVQKAAALGANALVALSAATTLATDAAQELGIMLIGFARDDQFTIYSHHNYLDTDGAAV